MGNFVQIYRVAIYLLLDTSPADKVFFRLVLNDPTALIQGSDPGIIGQNGFGGLSLARLFYARGSRF